MAEENPEAREGKCSYAGTVVVINGASSSGKTTLALGLRDCMGQGTAVLAIDSFFSFFGPQQHVDWNFYRSLTEVLFEAACSFAKQGYLVVVDTVFERQDCYRIASRKLGSVPSIYVGLRCDSKCLAARELARGDRRIGMASDQQGRIHEGIPYDLELDTFVSNQSECLGALLAFLESRFDA